jgi:hypothetical protein
MQKEKEKIEMLEGGESGPLINFTDGFWVMLGDLSDLSYDKAKVNDKTSKSLDETIVVCEFFFDLHQNDKYENKINLKTLDCSTSPDYFDVVLGEKTGVIGVSALLKYFMGKNPDFSSKYTKKQLDSLVQNFLIYYNRWVQKKPLIPSLSKTSGSTSTSKGARDDDYDYYDGSDVELYGGSGSWSSKSGNKSWGTGTSYGYGSSYGSKYYSVAKGDPVTVRPFQYDPKDVRSTFLSLTTETYPHGHEEEVMEYLPVPGLQKDQWGNYYLVIGNSDTMFTCHTDTASRTKSAVRVLSYTENGDEIFVTDGTSILGADDKAGVTILLYMIANRIPGVYYFFIGEERGAIGSSKVAENFDTIQHLRGMKKCISFDRRNYFSVITSQLSQTCCSNVFAQSLCDELNANGMQMRLDNTGVFTDSASFMDLIPECTNISVGYFSEHTHTEMQNISFLERLARATLGVNWNNLRIARKVGLDPSISAKYGSLIMKMKRQRLFNSKKVYTDDENFYLLLPVDETPILTVKRELETYKKLFDDTGFKPTIVFETGTIKFKFD